MSLFTIHYCACLQIQITITDALIDPTKTFIDHELELTENTHP